MRWKLNSQSIAVGGFLSEITWFHVFVWIFIFNGGFCSLHLTPRQSSHSLKTSCIFPFSVFCPVFSQSFVLLKHTYNSFLLMCCIAGMPFPFDTQLLLFAQLDKSILRISGHICLTSGSDVVWQIFQMVNLL